MSMSMKEWKSLPDEGQRDAVMDILKVKREKWTDLKTLRVLLWFNDDPTTKSPEYSEAVALANAVLPRMESLNMIEYDSEKKQFRARAEHWTHRRVYVGGTFNRFHDGHRALLDKVVETAESIEGPVDVILYVTSDRLAQSTRRMRVRPVASRAMDARQYLSMKGVEPELRILEKSDYVDPDAGPYDYLVCSKLTVPADPPVCGVVTVDTVCDEVGPISSTRIIRNDGIKSMMRQAADSGLPLVAVNGIDPIAAVVDDTNVTISDGVSRITVRSDMAHALIEGLRALMEVE